MATEQVSASTAQRLGKPPLAPVLGTPRWGDSTPGKPPLLDAAQRDTAARPCAVPPCGCGTVPPCGCRTVPLCGCGTKTRRGYSAAAL